MARKYMIFIKPFLKLLFLAVLGLISTLGLNLLAPDIANTYSVQIENLKVVNDGVVNTLNSIYGDTNLANLQPLEQDLLNPGIEAYQSGYFTKAKDLWEKALQSGSEDKLYQALVKNYLSLANQQLGNWDEAKKAVDESQKLLESLPDTSQVWQVRARSLTTQGHLQLALGKLEDALKSLENAEKIYTQLKDDEGAIGSQINQAQILQASGRYRRALLVLTKVQKTIDETQKDDRFKAIALLNLGNTLQVVGDLENSWCTLQKSLETAKIASPQLIADIWLSLGNVQRAFGKKAEDLQVPNSNQLLSLRTISECKNELKEDTNFAFNFYQEAEQWYEKVNITEVNLDTKVAANLNHLNVLLTILENEAWKDKWDNSFFMANKLITEISQEIDNLTINRREIYARINLACSLVILQQKSDKQKITADSISFLEIEKLLQKAHKHAVEIQDPRAESYALGNLGWLYEQTENWQKARELTEQSLNLAQGIKASDIIYQWAWQLGRIEIGQKQDDKAIKAYTQAVKTLKDFRLGLVGINLYLDKKEVSSDLQFYFRDRVEPVYRELIKLLLKSDDLATAINTIEDLKVAELENHLRCSLQEEKSAKIEDIDPKAAVIYTIILDNSLDTIVKFPNDEKLKHYLYQISKKDLEKTIINIQFKIDKPRFANQDRQLLNDLYKYLLKNIEQELNNKKPETLVFVLDGLLQNIPMSALYDGKKYLIEKYPVAQTPGLKLLKSEKIEKQFDILAAGVSKVNENLPALPYVATELNKIKSRFPRTQPLLDEQFSQNEFAKQIKARPISIVHLATHGQFSSQADNTYIAAWQNKIKVNELYDLLQTRTQINRNPIELMFLSACQTAAGDKRAALGLAGVAVRAGARSTIATLWTVKDDSSAILVDKFYKHLSDPKISNKANALQLAQQDLLKDNNYNKPLYWAAYVLIGNWL